MILAYLKINKFIKDKNKSSDNSEEAGSDKSSSSNDDIELSRSNNNILILQHCSLLIAIINYTRILAKNQYCNFIFVNLILQISHDI